MGTYIIEQTEQFRVVAASEEEAVEKLTNEPDPTLNPDVEWLAVTNRTVEEVSR